MGFHPELKTNNIGHYISDTFRAIHVSEYIAVSKHDNKGAKVIWESTDLIGTPNDVGLVYIPYVLFYWGSLPSYYVAGSCDNPIWWVFFL